MSHLYCDEMTAQAWYKPRSVFITGSASADLDVLRSVLEAEEIEAVTPMDAGVVRGHLAQGLADVIAGSSFVLVVLTDSPLPSAVLFEVGVAAALRRPLAVLDGRTDPLSQSGSEFALLALANAPVLQARLGDSDSLRRELRSYLHEVLQSGPVEQAAFRDGGRKPPSVSVGKEGGAVIECAQALERLGASVMLQPGADRNAPDMAVTVPWLGPAFDPILVEVAGLRARHSTKLDKLTEWMTIAGAHIGLLVTLDDVSLSKTRTSEMTIIISLSLRQLKSASVGDFRDWVTTARNSLVHGG